MESVCSVSKLSTECVGSRRQLVANCVHTADATKQFHRVGGVYWALLTYLFNHSLAYLQRWRYPTSYDVARGGRGEGAKKRGGNGRGEKRGSDGGKWGELEQGRRWAKAGALQVRLRQYWLILFNNQRLDKLRWFWPHHGLRTVEFKFSRILCHEWHNERLCRCSPGGVRKQRLLGNRRTVLLLGNKRHSARTEEPWTTVRRIHHRQRRRTCQLPRDVIVTSRWMTSSWHVLAVEGHVSYEEIVKLLRDEIGIRYAGK